ncbi:unnamed protein product [Notodromas monacha]|uniref:Molybdenum cofactor sulfurase middle domain-containing protein n=1 Tax=Notodromas monacha TaxID=399045 RepID=A0A7R9BLG1_9CRUS|nr:unnamed protein product [Notodromas monacha]CAG0916190.1 unnamed protein product [Notodromas monacha]
MENQGKVKDVSPTLVLLGFLIAGYLARQHYFKKANPKRDRLYWEPVAEVAKIFVFPLSYGNPMKVGVARASKTGFQNGRNYDGMFNVMDDELRIVSHESLPRIALISCRMVKEAIVELKAPSMKNIRIAFSLDGVLPTQVWHDEASFNVIDLGDEASHWITEFLLYKDDQDVQAWGTLRVAYVLPLSPKPDELKGFAMKDSSRRTSKDKRLKLTLVSEASVDHLNYKLSNKMLRTVLYRNFHPSIVVRKSEAYAEENWDIIKIGDVIFSASPCPRSFVLPKAPDAGETSVGFETLRTLREYRPVHRIEAEDEIKDPLFGIELNVLKIGAVSKHGAFHFGIQHTEHCGQPTAVEHGGRSESPMNSLPGCDPLAEFSFFVMAATLQPYLNAVRHTLTAAICVGDFSSQVVERHNKPEVEVKTCKELLLNPVIISRNEREKVLIEASVNSVRVSIAIKQADDIEKILCHKFMRFMMMRAENFTILRRKPVQGYDVSFLITNFHTEQMYKHKLVDFVIHFMEEIDKEISEMKLSVNARARICAEEFLKRMADRDSASESDSSSVDGGPIMMPPSPISREQLHKRIESLQQGNKVLRMELESMKHRVKQLQEENKSLRQASVTIQARAEQEEEFISNTLLKKIQALKKEKETLALNYEQEEECLTNDLSRKLNQLRQEKVNLEATLEQEQECLVNKLMRRIERLEAETNGKQLTLEQLRREKVELENTLEQEQEALVHKLWKKMGKLESEKRLLKGKLDGMDDSKSGPSSSELVDQPGSSSGTLNRQTEELPVSSPIAAPQSPQERPSQILKLQNEAVKLRQQLNSAQKEHNEKMHLFATEEKQIRMDNVTLQKKLALEKERRRALSRQLSESESSLEMDEDRYSVDGSTGSTYRTRAGSSPVNSGGGSSVIQHRPASPSKSAGSTARCQSCGQPIPYRSFIPPPSPPLNVHQQGFGGISVSVGSQGNANADVQFVKPCVPSPGGGGQQAAPASRLRQMAPTTGSPMPVMDFRSSVSPAPSPMDTSRGMDSEDDARSCDGDVEERKTN